MTILYAARSDVSGDGRNEHGRTGDANLDVKLRVVSGRDHQTGRRAGPGGTGQVHAPDLSLRQCLGDNVDIKLITNGALVADCDV